MVRTSSRRRAYVVRGTPASVTAPFKLACELERLVAEHRRSLGLSPTRRVQVLGLAAKRHSQRMVSLGFFDHEDPYDGTGHHDRVNAIDGPAWSVVAENLAAGQWTARQILDGWMDSPGHRRNIEWPGLDSIGTAIECGGTMRTYTTQLYGTQRHPVVQRFVRVERRCDA